MDGGVEVPVDRGLPPGRDSARGPDLPPAFEPDLTTADTGQEVTGLTYRALSGGCQLTVQPGPGWGPTVTLLIGLILIRRRRRTRRASFQSRSIRAHRRAHR